MLGLIASAWVARTLGPERYGAIAVALSIATVASTVAEFGLPQVTVRDLVRTPDQRGQIFGTILSLRVLFAGLIYAGLVSVLLLLPDHASVSTPLVLVVGLLVFTKIPEVAFLWFESRMQMRRAIQITLPAFVLASLLKIGLVQADLALSFIALAWILEPLIAGAAGWFMMHQPLRRLRRLRFSRAYAQTALRAGLPLFLTTMVATLYARVDQLMLGAIGNLSQVGIYTATMVITDGLLVLFLSANRYMRPAFILIGKSSPALLNQKLQQAYRLSIPVILLLSVMVAAGAGLIVAVTYGPAFAEATAALRVLVFSCAMTLIFNLHMHWYIAADMQHLAAKHLSTGLFLHVGLNLLLIPALGLVGAATAALVSRSFVALIAPLLDSRSRHLSVLAIDGLSMRGVVPAVKDLWRSRAHGG